MTLILHKAKLHRATLLPDHFGEGKDGYQIGSKVIPAHKAQVAPVASSEAVEPVDSGEILWPDGSVALRYVTTG